MKKLNNQAASTIEELVENIRERMENQIAGLTPDQHRRFEDALVAGASRYDALMEVVLSNTERNRLLLLGRFHCRNRGES
jgi:hypothetical protein